MLSIFDQAKREIQQNIERSQLQCPVYYEVSVGHGISYLGIRKSLESPVEIHSEFPLWDTSYLPLFPPLFSTASETYDSTALRMNAFFEYLQKKYKDTNILVIIVSHHDSLETLLHLKLANGEVVKFD